MVVSNSIGSGDQVQTVGFTYGLPPVPVINPAEIGNITISVDLNLSDFHDGLNISLVVSAIIVYFIAILTFETYMAMHNVLLLAGGNKR